MRTHLVIRAATAIALTLGLLALPAIQGPAQARTGNGNDGPVWTEGDDVLGQVRSQIDTLESGATGSGSGPAPKCDWEDTRYDVGDPRRERDDGELRWREPGIGSDEWIEDDWANPDGAEGTVWRYECWHDDMECHEAPTGNGCLGEPSDQSWCGRFLCTFDAVTPENLALLVAEDQFLEQLSTPQPRFSPPNEETLVNFDTWLWVDNIPDSGEAGPWGISILGGLMSVEATATMHEVRWDMGDDSDPESEFTCPLTVSEADAKDNCTYRYKRSSAGQPDNEFQGNVSVVWEVNWVANVFGQELTNDEPIEATLDNEFSLAVAESQAVVTDD